MRKKDVPITLKWGKAIHEAKISVQPGSSAKDFKLQVQLITKVPCSRQKLLCPKCWKGALKDGDILPDTIDIPKGKKALVVTLIGSTDAFVEKPPEERPLFVEDMTPAELKKTAQRFHNENNGRKVEHDVDVVAIQREQGGDRDRDGGKKEMYQYNRFVTGLPQHQIEDKLIERKTRNANDDGNLCLTGELAMVMGLELRRAYVNSLAVLDGGILVSGLDDGHIQMWYRGEMFKDINIAHRVEKVEIVASFPFTNEGGPAFVSGGGGDISIWSDEGVRLLGFNSPPGTTPASLVTGSISGMENMKYLASCFSITYQTNLSQFRLVPQDEAGRLRREAAEVQERLIQEGLARASRCVKIWFYDSASTNKNGVGFGTETLSFSGEGAVVTKLADLNGKLVCGDEMGGIRMFKWSTGSFGRSLSRQQEAFFQFQCPGYRCSINCMEPCQDDLLAVSIHPFNDLSASVDVDVRMISFASPLRIANPRGVFLVDVRNASLRAVFDAHLDIVQCICALPDGGMLTAGGKMDATVKVWDSQAINGALQNDPHQDESEEDEKPPIFTNEQAKTLKEPGYVFDLKVLPDSNLDKKVYGVAGARYNVIKIII